MNTNASGLGRGLSSLIPNKKAKDFLTIDETEAKAIGAVIDGEERILALPVDEISPNPYQPREEISDESLGELVESIKEYGIIQPLIVTKIKANDYQLIAGERRLRAAKLLGLKTAPAIIRDASEQKKSELALIENLHHQDLNALEIAAAYKILLDQFNLNQDELAQKLGKSRPAITNTLRILGVREEVKQAIRAGRISEGHARVLSGLPPADQLTLLDRMLAEKLSVRETETAGRKVALEKNLRSINLRPEIIAKEEALANALGTKVRITKSGRTGQIVIKYFSPEELEGIVNKIIS